MSASQLRLRGPGTRGKRVSGALLRDLLGALVPAVQRSVRLRLEGRSTAPGSTPAWLEQAASFDFVGTEEGSTVILLDSPKLADAAREKFAQVELWSELDPEQTCLDVLADSLADALSGNADSDRYDDGLLTTFADLQKVFRYGVDAMELANHRHVCIRQPEVVQLETLKRRIAPDQRVIVAGRLDAMRHSDRMFTLELESGATLRGVLDDRMPIDQLRPLWGELVKVSGTAKFRPSGAVLRIEADDVRAGEGNLALWSAAPRPVLAPLDTRALRRSQGPRSGVSAVFGQWPGDESDEAFEQAISELS